VPELQPLLEASVNRPTPKAPGSSPCIEVTKKLFKTRIVPFERKGNDRPVHRPLMPGPPIPHVPNVQSRASHILSVQQMLGGSLGTRVRQLARNYRINAQRGHMTGGTTRFHERAQLDRSIRKRIAGGLRAHCSAIDHPYRHRLDPVPELRSYFLGKSDVIEKQAENCASQISRAPFVDHEREMQGSNARPGRLKANSRLGRRWLQRRNQQFAPRRERTVADRVGTGARGSSRAAAHNERVISILSLASPATAKTLRDGNGTGGNSRSCRGPRSIETSFPACVSPFLPS